MNLELVYLPEEMKRDLCVEILEQIGVTNIVERGDELIHGCKVSSYHMDQERNPTASLNFQKLAFNCLGCQSAGGLVWFVATTLGLSEQEARQWLSAKSGDEGDSAELLLKYYDAMYTPKALPEPLPCYDERMISHWQIDDHPYLLGRGISRENIVRFRLGYDKEKDGIIIPHFFKSNLVGWQTRYLKSMPKYKSTPSFPKARTLFNYDHRAREVILVEAPISVVKHEGRYHWEATIGAKTTEEQIALMHKHDRVYLWMDNDREGWKATHRIAQALISSCDVWVIDSPFRGDPGDLPQEMVERIFDSFRVPYASWNPPRLLMCHACMEFDDDCSC